MPQRLWTLSPTTFSSGEKQRTNIARDFAHAYPAMLLYEPTASLDATNREVVLSLIAEAKAGGAAIIHIFHDQATRAHVCDQKTRRQCLYAWGGSINEDHPIAVVVPSRVGKDSMMQGLAKAMEQLNLVRLVPTRASELEGEDYDAVSRVRGAVSGSGQRSYIRCELGRAWAGAWYFANSHIPAEQGN